MRKFHQKTRRGCRQCKSRHIKCGRADLPCSFVADMPVPRPWNPDQPHDGTARSGSPSLHLGPGLYTRRVLHNPPIRLDSTDSQPFNMLYFRLFHYFEHDMSAFLTKLHPGFDELAKLYVYHSLRNHYLMEELLAYSAAHMSTHVQVDRDMYVQEAMKMQTRALALYNGISPQVSKETCLPMFLYSSLLSHHIVFDVRSNMQDDLGVAIGWLTHSIGIHRGLMALGQTAWPMLTQETKDVLTRACHREDGPVPSSDCPGTECQSLLARLRASGVKPPALDHLCATVELLQDRMSAIKPGDTHSTWSVIQDWLVAIPEEYIDLLKERNPEALVVLGYFCVLLHRAAEHWFVEDLGARLARMITSYLGPIWAEWMRWPNIVTGNLHPIPAGSYGLLF
ncbi:hypothetical protein NLU13_9604 [Sarocladium strictum]|uniref:Zn(2)-C6 fungal-type domain-containing protein n=1 Tax=Sarocladium strictum TaxID=5046 RepID=A0AA39GAE6_SARSR|nr:hypothetical protein NLU13_9604 [Sarocladium strictum]